MISLTWPTFSGFDLFYHIILAIYLAIFFFLHANHIRSLILTMADMMNPQTPPRKLFKPSSKTKTPTPVKRQRPITPAASSTQSHEVLTPTETISRSTDRPGALETEDPIDGSTEEGSASDQTISPAKSIAGKPREFLSSSTDDLPEPSNPTDALNSPIDIAKYFSEQGNSEMSAFVSALSGKTSSDGAIDPAKGALHGSNKMMSHVTSELPNNVPSPTKELPRDDTLIIPPKSRTRETLEEPKTSDLVNLTEASTEVDIPETANSSQGFNEKMANISTPTDASKKAEGNTNDAKAQMSGTTPINVIGEPDISSISKEAHIGVQGSEMKRNGGARNIGESIDQKANTRDLEMMNDGTQIVDNMGNPAHIERRIEIPLTRPEKVVNSPPQPTTPDMKNIASGLYDPNELPGTQGLPSTDSLPGLPDELQDPPEEVLDPSVHSPSSNVSPIPKIPKITPIGVEPPPDLRRLAYGLGGNVIDDVGNIIDASETVLGHVTGDLPAMVGRKVADNGEVYGDGGELIGYVSENFISPPPPTDIPEKVLGGLKVDHEGNILDNNGNIIGRFNEKAGENDDLAPFIKPSKMGESEPDDEPQEEKKPKVNAHTGGSPSDIFLDVKSTTDGIQLTIRIPTTFGKRPQDP
ncbi:uncharacterized protein GGS22DRAFT_154123 [Annulohypoxylon maeteangense]|uniref:uncharacterized protein n=1 Tax=Annulohypoxylon maeteangense TaxID=1927788 RepID=UPI0020083187|nr:uncharacterized protein GGS22DRAFT_154123 [Annulohypoxylon maeteangense]KAI0887727.1 hypothetical protein GGS22DRAFT_154123 [Annulohypoxylon maeteangense]